MKKVSEVRKFLIDRLVVLRNRANLSARELSQRLGKSIAYIAKFENGDFSIPAEILLDAILICGGTPEEFFSEDFFEYEKNKEFYKKYKNLSTDSKETLKNLIDNMK